MVDDYEDEFDNEEQRLHRDRKRLEMVFLLVVGGCFLLGGVVVVLVQFQIIHE